MSRHHEPWAQRDQAGQRRDPVLAVGLADEGDAATKHQVAREENARLGDEDHQILGCVRRPDMADHELERADLQPGFLRIQPAIGAHEAGVLVDPRRELLPARLEAPLRRVGVQILAPVALREDRRSSSLEGLQAVDVIGVVVRDDHIADRLRRQAPDRFDQLLRERRGPQCVDHDHAVVGDHEAGVGDEVSIRKRAECRLALHEPDRLGQLLRLHRHRRLDAAACERPEAQRGHGRAAAPCGDVHRVDANAVVCAAAGRHAQGLI